MAKQRQTNVNINYTVNTADLEKGNVLLARASKATDDLRKASDSYARTATAQNKNVSTSIGGMQLQLQRLRAQIEYTNKADTKRLAELSGQYKALKREIDNYNRALFQTNTANKQVTASANGMASQFRNVYNTIRLVIAAGMARELVNTALSAATLAGQIEGVERAFSHAFPNSVMLLEDLRRATHGTVSDFELMKQALTANNFQIPVKELGTLLEFAAVRAQQTGQSVDYLVDSIVRGIGMKSILRLDNLGLSATRLREKFDDASIASQSIGEVTRGVAEIAREELEKMGGYLETSATVVDQTKVSWENLKAELADASFWQAIVANIKGMTESVTATLRVLKGQSFEEQIAEDQRKQIALISANEFMTRRLGESKEKNIEIIQEEVQALTEDLGAYTRFRDKMEDVIASQRAQLRVIEGQLKVGKDGQKIRTAEAVELEQSIALHERILQSKKEDALIDQEIIRLLQAKVVELKKVNAEESGGEPFTGRGRPPRMTQVVDLRYRDPDTGEISKLRNDKILRDFIGKGLTIIGDMPPAEIKVVPIVLLSDWERALEANREQLIDAGQTIIQQQLDSILFAEVQAYDARIDALRAFYDEQISLAGDNERVKQELRIKEEREIKKLEQVRADREKKAVLASIRTNTALSIIKVWSGEGTWVDKLIRAGIVAAIGASQYVAASRERYYAKGAIDIQGPGTSTSDSIPARLSKGESVMTAQETMASKGILKAVRAKKLNDKVLSEIVSGRSGGASVTAFDDSRMLKKLEELKNAQPDVIQRANMIYEVRRKGDNYKQIVRSKSMIS